jgi:hypothetical protein
MIVGDHVILSNPAQNGNFFVQDFRKVGSAPITMGGKPKVEWSIEKGEARMEAALTTGNFRSELLFGFVHHNATPCSTFSSFRSMRRRFGQVTGAE